MMAGSGSCSTRSLDALTARTSRPTCSPPRWIPRRLVPSAPVPTDMRMCAGATSRPKWRQTIARQATPQSISSSWRTYGNGARLQRLRTGWRRRSRAGWRLRQLVHGHSGFEGLLRLALVEHQCSLDRVGGQQLGEVQGHRRRLASLVDVNVVLDAGAKLRVLAEQLAEQALVKRQQTRPAHGLDAGHARHPQIQRKLAEEVTGAQELGVVFVRPASLKGPQPALLDDEERPAGVALADDKLSRLELDRGEAREHRRDRRLRQAGEGRVNAQEVRETPGSRLQRERVANRRVDTDERREDGNVQALTLHVAGGAHTGGAGRAFQQPRLAEGLSLVEDAQRDLLAVVCQLHHAGQP